MAIEVLNPVPGGERFTSIRRARKYVDSGRAHWVNGSRCIRFYSQHERKSIDAAKHAQEIKAKAQDQLHLGDRAVHSKIATRREMIGLPLVNPAEMLAPSGSRRDWAYGKAVRQNSAFAVNGDWRKREADRLREHAR